MKFREYAASKAITLCFIGMLAAAAVLYMVYSDVSAGMIAMIAFFLILCIVGWLLCGFWQISSKLNKLHHIQRELSEQYLLGELLPPPSNAIEKEYYDVMKTVSRAAINKAESAIREKDEYCDYVESWIHEIKTPLTACSLILSNDADPRKLKRELKRADNLTENILYYARMRTADKDLQISAVQCAEVMDEAVKSQMELLIAAGISVEIEGDFTVYTDRKPLCFILKQLLINSAKYAPGCKIQMTARDGAICVYDNGAGIPDYDITRVTQRGFTGTNGRKFGGGTGMGLYIVNGLCAQLCISFEIESEVGKYTKITLTFEHLTKM